MTVTTFSVFPTRHNDELSVRVPLSTRTLTDVPRQSVSLGLEPICLIEVQRKISLSCGTCDGVDWERSGTGGDFDSVGFLHTRHWNNTKSWDYKPHLLLLLSNQSHTSNIRYLESYTSLPHTLRLTPHTLNLTPQTSNLKPQHLNTLHLIPHISYLIPHSLHLILETSHF